MTNALKIFGIIIATLILFTIVHGVSHKIGMKAYAKGNNFGAVHKMRGSVKDRNKNIVRHGFLQHHIHDGSGNVLWQKPSDPELVVQPESE